MQNVYSVFDYSGTGSVAGPVPRIGLGELTAAEKAAAAAAYNQGLASKSGSMSAKGLASQWQLVLVMVMLAVACGSWL